MIVSACPEGWSLTQTEETNGNPGRSVCYKFHSHKKSWDDARSACKDQGGDLANIKYGNEYVSFCAQYVTESRKSVFALAYIWHTMRLS